MKSKYVLDSDLCVLDSFYVDCDKACKKICHGFGPSKCAECASGYTRDEHGVCKGEDIFCCCCCCLLVSLFILNLWNR